MAKARYGHGRDFSFLVQTNYTIPSNIFQIIAEYQDKEINRILQNSGSGSCTELGFQTT